MNPPTHQEAVEREAVVAARDWRHSILPPLCATEDYVADRAFQEGFARGAQWGFDAGIRAAQKAFLDAARGDELGDMDKLLETGGREGR